jgi:CheY-like chemotaxis protein
MTSAHARRDDATVLVVDDEPGVRAGTKRILERLGYHVLEASNGAEALRVFAEKGHTIRLVILDMAMPVMGGAECARRLAEITTVPILLATGYAIDEEVQALVARGAALLEKPYAATQLMVEVARLLEVAAGRGG